MTIGYLGGGTRNSQENRLQAFLHGLKDAGYTEGQDFNIEYRWANGRNDQLPILAGELVQRRVAVIVAAGGTASALAAKGAATAIPIVFAIGADPITAGLVDSLKRPGKNITGVTSMNLEVGPKRLELARELLPTIKTVAILVNPADPAVSEPFTRALKAAADSFGLQLHTLGASSERDFDKVFTTAVQLQAGALIVGPDNLFTGWSELLAELALRHALPTIYQFRRFVAAGGLISYGSSETEYYHSVGLQTARILKGENPADLPVQQSTKVELVVNLKSAKAMRLKVPLPLLARADDVIE
jgi:putative ABC transport system substrate-binding protein